MLITQAVVTATANVTVDALTSLVLVNADAVIVTLPAASTAVGRSMTTRNITTAYNATVKGNSAELVGDANTITLWPNHSVTVISDGTKWHITASMAFMQGAGGRNKPAIWDTQTSGHTWSFNNGGSGIGGVGYFSIDDNTQSKNVLTLDPNYSAHIINAYFEHARSTPMGEWVALANTALACSGGTWTSPASVMTLKYTLIGKTITLAWAIAGGTLSVNTQYLTISPGFTVNATTVTFAVNEIASVRYSGYALALAGESFIRIYKENRTTANNWLTTETTNMLSDGQITYEIQ